MSGWIELLLEKLIWLGLLATALTCLLLWYTLIIAAWKWLLGL